GVVREIAPTEPSYSGGVAGARGREHDSLERWREARIELDCPPIGGGRALVRRRQAQHIAEDVERISECTPGFRPVRRNPDELLRGEENLRVRGGVRISHPYERHQVGIIARVQPGTRRPCEMFTPEHGLVLASPVP